MKIRFHWTCPICRNENFDGTEISDYLIVMPNIATCERCDFIAKIEIKDDLLEE